MPGSSNRASDIDRYLRRADRCVLSGGLKAQKRVLSRFGEWEVWNGNGEAEFAPSLRLVRFARRKGQTADIAICPLCAKSGCEQPQRGPIPPQNRRRPRPREGAGWRASRGPPDKRLPMSIPRG